jgi:glutamyl-tRNA reductase
MLQGSHMYSAILDFTEKAGVDVLILGESQIYMQMAACMLSIPQQAACMVTLCQLIG